MQLQSPKDPNIKRLYRWVDNHQQEIIEALRGVLQIPSVQAEPAPGAPFGQPVRQALDYTLQLCAKLGFRVKDVDGYAGHAEFGDGTEMVAALGHLDVVPEGDGWSYPPYGAVLDDGYIYARGASDDKGPTYAALFAARALMDCGVRLRRRVRIIFGCNEESGFRCVEHYFGVAGEERPVMGFTPDASFPLIYAEKGIANLVLTSPLPGQHSPARIVSLRGGLRPNMVPESAEATITGDPAELLRIVGVLNRYWDQNVSFDLLPDGIKIVAQGKSAHGSRPWQGDNAVTRLIRALCALQLPETGDWLEWLLDSADVSGTGLGIAHRDDVSGALTSNLGLIATNDATVTVTYNVRYPVTWSMETLRMQLKPVIAKAGWTLAEHTDSPPLYVPLDQEPVATLLRVYREATGDTASEPRTMGGGTYARATPRTVAYGAAFPTATQAYGPAHEPDERIHVTTLLNATRIYAHALYELAK
ncbi:MAG: dipeptidase PepV [Chloroherpetonaceae bacterium]|nr:dipeptidase PepV [Chloroherpetonaceae bacterium]